MRMRFVWAVLFVMMPLAAVAGYGSTYGVGGVAALAEGALISGAAALRLVCTDASGNLDTASPCTGAALTLTGALSGTSSNFTGQMVFDGVTTDQSTGTNQDWTVGPNGTGNVVAITENTTMTQDNAITTLVNSSSNQILATQGGATTAYADFRLRNSSGTTTGQWIYFGSTYSDTELQNKTLILSSSVMNGFARGDDVAAGTCMSEFRDNTSGTGVQQFCIDGNGAARFRDLTSAHGATCNSSNEGLLYYRSISASNKSGFCACAETSSGTYAWKAALTFGSSALTDGDC